MVLSRGQNKGALDPIVLCMTIRNNINVREERLFNHLEIKYYFSVQ